WVVGRFAPPRAARGSVLDVSADGVVELDMGGDGGPRSLLISHAPAADDADAVARWTRADLAHGLPRLAPAQAGQWTPQQLSLERLNAFSVKKGCYPGQEIVARTHFLGQAKRGLALLQASTPVAAGADVMAAGRAIGIIASVQGPLALAVLPLERGDGVLEAGGVALQALTLLGGLAR
ncbi:MAG: folate-binding protein, partial [Lysobacteraceae bacterium]